MQENSDPVCCSGGAEGADLEWGCAATKSNHAVMHFVFAGHRSRADKDQLVELTKDQLEVANDHLARANKSLHRRWPVSNYFVGNLLRRNYYQVVWSQSLYAISGFDSYGMVEGGTAWAVQMMIDLNPGAGIYVFDQKVGQWYQWKGGWVPVIKPPKPDGIYAGIGSRKLLTAGKEAIWKVFE